jgi:hypothetical protein
MEMELFSWNCITPDIRNNNTLLLYILKRILEIYFTKVLYAHYTLLDIFDTNIILLTFKGIDDLPYYQEKLLLHLIR